MSWRNKLHKASFRGVKFYVDSSEIAIGRNIEIQQRVGSNKYTVQDLGAFPDEFIVIGHIIQNQSNGYDYFRDRDKLITAFKKAGSGTLIHPFFGKIKVAIAEPVKMTETFEEGGIARFEVIFVKDYDEKFPGESKDFNGLVDNSVLNAVNEFLDMFTGIMDTAGAFLDSITGPITDTMNRMISSVNSINGAIASTIRAATGIINTAISSVDSVLTAPCTLIGTIKDAGDSFLGLVGMAGEVVTGGIVGSCSGVRRGDVVTLSGTSIPEDLGTSVIQEMVDSATFTESDITSTVPTEQTDNQTLCLDGAMLFMLGNACKIGVRIDFESEDKMIEITELVADALDTFLLRLGAESINNTDVYNAVQEMRSTFIDSMYEKNTDIAKTIDYQVSYDVETALTLVYNKYYDLDRDVEIQQRNRSLARHPGFLPGGQNISILNE